MYRWWVFVHLSGVFGLLISHGASIALAFQLRRERDPGRIETLLQLSGNSIRVFYTSLIVLLVGAFAATTDGGLWGHGWIWASLVALAMIMVVMYFVARPYYHRIRFVAGAMAAGSTAVTPQQLDELLRSRRGLATISIGLAGLVLILYLMLFKPALGITPRATSAAGTSLAPQVTLVATESAFTVDNLTVEADEPFLLALDNRSSVPHNISIYADHEALFVGDVFSGPQEVAHELPALEPGTYEFRCDVHPEQMTGVLEAR